MLAPRGQRRVRAREMGAGVAGGAVDSRPPGRNECVTSVMLLKDVNFSFRSVHLFFSDSSLIGTKLLFLTVPEALPPRLDTLL